MQQLSNKCFFEDKLDQFVVRRLSDLDRPYFVLLVKIDEINGYDCFLKNGELKFIDVPNIPTIRICCFIFVTSNSSFSCISVAMPYNRNAGVLRSNKNTVDT